MSSSDKNPSDSSIPQVPQGPLKVADDCWMVGHRNPESMLQCNTYVRTFNRSGGAYNVCIDPGSQFDYSVVEANVGQLVGDMREIHAVTINHQDPDVAGNAPQFCDANPNLEMMVSEETWRLLQHSMLTPGKLRLSHATRTVSTEQPFQFVRTPFCHFRGAMAMYDPEHRILYTGDLFGGLNRIGRVHLMASEDDWSGIAQFHQIYMPSREILRFAVRKILNLRPKVEVIAPQHGHVITGDLVGLFLERMHELLVGNDLLAQYWDADNLAGYQEVIQRLVDCAIEQRGELNVVGCINTHDLDDELHTHLQLKQRDVRLQSEGYSALGKAFARLADGEPDEYVAMLRRSVTESAEEFGLPIPPVASGFHPSSGAEPS